MLRSYHCIASDSNILINPTQIAAVVIEKVIISQDGDVIIDVDDRANPLDPIEVDGDVFLNGSRVRVLLINGNQVTFYTWGLPYEFTMP